MPPEGQRRPGAGGVVQLTKLLNQSGIGGRGRRSTLTRWLRAHYADFAAMLADKEPGWDEVAAALATMGLLDGKSEQPNGDRVRKAWWAVRQAKEAAIAAKAHRSVLDVPRAAGEITPGVQAVVAPSAELTEARPRKRLDLRPARALIDASALADSPALNGPRPAAPEGRASSETATEQMLRVFDAMEAGKTPMPKVIQPVILPPAKATEL